MDAGARQSLKRYFLTAIIIMVAVSAVVWTVPALLGEDASPAPTVTVTTPEVLPEELDRFMDDALRRIGSA